MTNYTQQQILVLETVEELSPVTFEELEYVFNGKLSRADIAIVLRDGLADGYIAKTNVHSRSTAYCRTSGRPLPTADSRKSSSESGPSFESRKRQHIVRHLLETGEGTTPEEIERQTWLDMGDVRQALSTLTKQGEILCVSPGEYRPINHQPAPEPESRTTASNRAEPIYLSRLARQAMSTPTEKYHASRTKAVDKTETPTPDDFTLLSGVGRATEQKLRNAGYDTFADIASTSIADLVSDVRIGDEKARSIIEQSASEAGHNGSNSDTGASESLQSNVHNPRDPTPTEKVVQRYIDGEIGEVGLEEEMERAVELEYGGESDLADGFDDDVGRICELDSA